MNAPLLTSQKPAIDAAAKTSKKNNSQAWYRPITSPEHGIYVMLAVAFLTGAAAAQHWNWNTTLALICGFCGFQAEHPWILQIKQRKSFKPRFWIWGGLYSVTAAVIAVYLYWIQADWTSPLLFIYSGAIVAFMVDAISVFQREQKSILNELITFAAVCLSAPFAYVVTTGTISGTVIGLWLLNSLFFSSTIFTVKFRKDKSHAVTPALLYHGIAACMVLGLAAVHWLNPVTACAFAVALLKFGAILWQRQWYCHTKIQFVAMLETAAAILFLAVVSLSLLPAHLPG